MCMDIAMPLLVQGGEGDCGSRVTVIVDICREVSRLGVYTGGCDVQGWEMGRSHVRPWGGIGRFRWEVRGRVGEMSRVERAQP